jgi:hypothetical protein
MAVVVIGGHTRNIGKTSVMAGLIGSLPEMQWTAIKITQYGHGICSANGEPCDCVTADHSLAVSEERDTCTGTDTSRYLAAGAARSLWVRTQQGQLAEAMPRVRKEITAARNALVESNSVLHFLRPDLYLAVLDPANPDFKPSALRYLDRADALLLASPLAADPAWPNISNAMLKRIPSFLIAPPTYLTSALVEFVRARIELVA